MVDPETFKRNIKNIVAQEYTLEFLGNNCDQIVLLLSEINAEKIYAWIKRVAQKDIQPIAVASPKQYKDWTVSQLLVFRYPFTLNNIEYLILFVKVKNSLYIEFHLGDHKYYDTVRKDLNLKKSSY